MQMIIDVLQGMQRWRLAVGRGLKMWGVGVRRRAQNEGWDLTLIISEGINQAAPALCMLCRKSNEGGKRRRMRKRAGARTSALKG